MNYLNSNADNLDEEEIIKRLKGNDIADEILKIPTDFWDNSPHNFHTRAIAMNGFLGVY